MPVKPQQKAASPGRKAAVLFVSWLIPGFGFICHGMWIRGIIIFVLLQATFLLGAALHASVLWPDFNIRSEGFNIVNIIMFFCQMFNGLLASISLMPDLLGARFALLPYDETNAWNDLGAMFLIVSGGLNYVAIASSYDYFYGVKRALLIAPPSAIAASESLPEVVSETTTQGPV